MKRPLKKWSPFLRGIRSIFFAGVHRISNDLSFLDLMTSVAEERLLVSKTKMASW